MAQDSVEIGALTTVDAQLCNARDRKGEQGSVAAAAAMTLPSDLSGALPERAEISAERFWVCTRVTPHLSYCALLMHACLTNYLFAGVQPENLEVFSGIRSASVPPARLPAFALPDAKGTGVER